MSVTRHEKRQYTDLRVELLQPAARGMFTPASYTVVLIPVFHPYFVFSLVSLTRRIELGLPSLLYATAHRYSP